MTVNFIQLRQDAPHILLRHVETKQIAVSVTFLSSGRVEEQWGRSGSHTTRASEVMGKLLVQQSTANIASSIKPKVRKHCKNDDVLFDLPVVPQDHSAD